MTLSTQTNVKEYQKNVYVKPIGRYIWPEKKLTRSLYDTKTSRNSKNSLFRQICDVAVSSLRAQ